MDKTLAIAVVFVVAGIATALHLPLQQPTHPLLPPNPLQLALQKINSNNRAQREVLADIFPEQRRLSLPSLNLRNGTAPFACSYCVMVR
jgi:hypothetical protein